MWWFDALVSRFTSTPMTIKKLFPGSISINFAPMVWSDQPRFTSFWQWHISRLLTGKITTLVVDLATQNEHMKSIKGSGHVLHCSDRNKKARTGNQFQRGVVGQLLSKPKCHNCYECSEKRFVSESNFFQHEHLPPLLIRENSFNRIYLHYWCLIHFRSGRRLNSKRRITAEQLGFRLQDGILAFLSLSVLISTHLLMQQPNIVIV